MTEHRLKVWPEPFQALWDGRKRHEVRVFDRPFAVGDRLHLFEYVPDGYGKYTGRCVRVSVEYITAPGTFGLPADVGVMSIKLLERC